MYHFEELAETQWLFILFATDLIGFECWWKKDWVNFTQWKKYLTKL
jgi:hypothetical protein